MPFTTRQVTRDEPDGGMTCDACGKEDPTGTNDFALEHHFGCDSPCDGTSVSAAVCDECLLRIVLANVPGATFREFDRTLDGEALAELGKDASPSDRAPVVDKHVTVAPTTRP